MSNTESIAPMKTSANPLNNLPITQKLALIIVIFILPILFLLYSDYAARNDSIAVARKEMSGNKVVTALHDAREAVSAALRLLRVQADGAGVNLRGVLPQGAMEVDADRRAIKQIVLNLVSNALKFTPKGGSVTVTAHGYDGVFELVVSDTGVGIAREDLERLGRPYEQAGDSSQRQRGTGLGLSLVRSFAELHGGEMILESTVGEGTSVTVRLPVLQEPGQGSPPPIGDNVIAFNPLR